ncbi:MAG: potassium-transporting ATPase subunit KdpA, partial [Alphaproteobacteria bacterium]|nr:potassium-transporting ATPase subunit KdpA [Alphaproteobacteria bacterium]
MSEFDIYQLLLFVFILAVVMIPLGYYMARIFQGERVWLSPLVRPAERAFYALSGIKADGQMNWRGYLLAAVVFNLVGMLFLMLILMFQDLLPLNPQHFAGTPWHLAFNVAVSFMTNTNWQSYAGESTLSPLSQMVGLTVQNFMSSATGLAVAVAVIRSFTQRENPNLGNFYVDVTRVTLYVKLPLAIIFAVFLLWQGVPQTFNTSVTATTLEGAQQTIAVGPVASQIAIKMLGSNGGGYFNANGAHPFENPTGLSDFVQLVSILLLPISFVVTFGFMIRDKRQAWALLVSMTLMFVIGFVICYVAEANGSHVLDALGVDQHISNANIGGNLEGKEVRFGIMNSTLWATATSATSNGSVNSMFDSYTALGGLVPLFNLLLGEVIYGGVGCGLYGIIIYALITVFIAGLMVGRTPEYLGKKIEAKEVKWAIVAQLLYPVTVLGGGMLALILPDSVSSLSASGPHGLTQMLYAYASAAANNGSAFGGLSANTLYQNVALGIVMLVGRFGVIVPILAIAGSLASKKIIPVSNGT